MHNELNNGESPEKIIQEKIIQGVRKLLADNADPLVRQSSRRFFRAEQKAEFYGLRSAQVSRIAKQTFQEVKNLPKDKVWALCEKLWQSGYQEEIGVACLWSQALLKKCVPADFVWFEGWLRSYVGNWASCDMFCNHTIGGFLIAYPEFVDNLKGWTSSENRWVRRGAAVSLIIPARKGMFLEDVFALAGALLADPDEMVQKGYGWMLKAASQAYPEEVFDYVLARKALMPRTALRYAIEKLPQEARARVMARS